MLIGLCERSAYFEIRAMRTEIHVVMNSSEFQVTQVKNERGRGVQVLHESCSMTPSWRKLGEKEEKVVVQKMCLPLWDLRKLV